jgi:hypothetical protein
LNSFLIIQILAGFLNKLITIETRLNRADGQIQGKIAGRLSINFVFGASSGIKRLTAVLVLPQSIDRTTPDNTSRINNKE